MRGLNFVTPENKRDAMKIIQLFELEWNKAMNIKNKRSRCSSLRRIYRSVNNIFIECKKNHIENNDNNMRDIARMFSKWMKKRGYVISNEGL
tara:strand:- start:658 stop:933 length:276 start_codon:yes stop_codon:yes gene_type:complete